ncbi:MAG: KilA-N domain-containing protein [Bacteroidota bacterium]
MPNKVKILHVKNTTVSFIEKYSDDYISLTDIARHRNPQVPKDIIKNWLRNRGTLEFLGLWEQINNKNFKGVEFDSLLYQAGSNSFTLSPSKWIQDTNAKGLITKTGKGGGTYAQKDIAFEFASWLSAEFKLYLIKEFQRLKNEEIERESLDWNLHRTLAKINYKVHTDAVKEKLIPPVINPEQKKYIYASEADLLNIALFGVTAKEWKDCNTGKQGNIRDHSTLEQLLVLANMESMNAEFIRMGISKAERLNKLNEIAINQMKSIIRNIGIKELKKDNRNEPE